MHKLKFLSETKQLVTAVQTNQINRIAAEKETILRI
jgi:hypothetical protein